MESKQTPNRFDYVAYDLEAQAASNSFKKSFMELDDQVEAVFATPRSAGVARYKAMLITKLEEAYMMVGKAVRDDQIARNGTAPLQEGRKDG